jgi:hypothetical protein
MPPTIANPSSTTTKTTTILPADIFEGAGCDGAHDGRKGGGPPGPGGGFDE